MPDDPVSRPDIDEEFSGTTTANGGFALPTLPDATHTNPDSVIPIPDSRSRTKIVKEQ